MYMYVKDIHNPLSHVTPPPPGVGLGEHPNSGYTIGNTQSGILQPLNRTT